MNSAETTSVPQPPSSTPTNEPELKPSSSLDSDAPILNLMGKTVSQMSDDELREHLTKLRMLTTTPPALTSALTVDLGTKKAKRPAVDATKATANLLADLGI